MKIVKSQDMCTSIPVHRILRTTVEKKEDNRWIITATVEHDRPVTLARYPSDELAIAMDVKMWISDADVFIFPTSDMAARGLER